MVDQSPNNDNQNVKIRVKDLRKSFGSKEVLKGVDLEVNAGESLVIIGGSGSGKSVLIKNVATLMEPTSGSVEIDGRNITHLNRRDKDHEMEKFGFLFQGGALFDSLPIWKNIAFRLLQNGQSNRKEAMELAISKLEDVGLNADVANLKPSELSGGMQKRVSLARAIASSPEIIFFDEPTTGLDPIMTDVINSLIAKCSKELNATTVTITHDMSSVRKIADKVAMLYKGKIIWFGKKEDIDNSGNPYVDQFINGRAEGPITN